MLGGDGGLDGVGRCDAGPLREGESLLQLVAAPERAVLVLEQHEIAGGVEPGVAPRVVEEHESEQAERLVRGVRELAAAGGVADITAALTA